MSLNQATQCKKDFIFTFLFMAALYEKSFVMCAILNGMESDVWPVQILLGLVHGRKNIPNIIYLKFLLKYKLARLFTVYAVSQMGKLYFMIQGSSDTM